MFVLLIMERFCTLNSYLSIINKINTRETNTRHLKIYEAFFMKVGGAETSKFGLIPQFGDFRSKFSSSPRSPESDI